MVSLHKAWAYGVALSWLPRPPKVHATSSTPMNDDRQSPPSAPKRTPGSMHAQLTLQRDLFAPVCRLAPAAPGVSRLGRERDSTRRPPEAARDTSDR